MTDLLPCPFCGGTAYDDLASLTIFGRRTSHKYAVACRECEASSPGAQELIDAYREWNKRHYSAFKLRWVPYFEGFHGNGIFSYTVLPTVDNKTWRWSRYDSGVWYYGIDGEPPLDADSAKKAAEKDYQERISQFMNSSNEFNPTVEKTILELKEIEKLQIRLK